jgi:cytochrome c oxidase cbb3-type subunit 3
MKPRILIGLLFALGLAAADGDAVFKAHCAPCHGSDGKGNSGVGTPDFTNAKTLSGLSDPDVIATISNGRKGTIMPAWKGKLSDEEITAVAAYVRSLGRK